MDDNNFIETMFDAIVENDLARVKEAMEDFGEGRVGYRMGMGPTITYDDKKYHSFLDFAVAEIGRASCRERC